MADAHQPGQLLLVYPAVDGHPAARLIGQVQTLPGFLAGTGAGQVQMQPQVPQADEGAEQPVNPLGKTQLAGIEQVDRRWLRFVAGRKEFIVIAAADDIDVLALYTVESPLSCPA